MPCHTTPKRTTPYWYHFITYHIMFFDCSWTPDSTCFHKFSASLTLNIPGQSTRHRILLSLWVSNHLFDIIWYYSISLIDIDGFDMFRARHCFASCFQNSSKFQCRVPAVLSTGGFWDLAGPLRQSLIVGKRHRRSLKWPASKCCKTRCVLVRPALQCPRFCKISKGPFLSKSSGVMVLLGQLICACPLFLFRFSLQWASNSHCCSQALHCECWCLWKQNIVPRRCSWWNCCGQTLATPTSFCTDLS